MARADHFLSESVWTAKSSRNFLPTLIVVHKLKFTLRASIRPWLPVCLFTSRGLSAMLFRAVNVRTSSPFSNPEQRVHSSITCLNGPLLGLEVLN